MLIAFYSCSKNFQVLTKAILTQEKATDDDTSDIYETPIAQAPRLLSDSCTLIDTAQRHAYLHAQWSAAVRRRMKWCGFSVSYLRSELNPPYKKGTRFANMWLNGGEKKKNIQWWEQCYDGGFVTLTRDDAKGMVDKQFSSVGTLAGSQ